MQKLSASQKSSVSKTKAPPGSALKARASKKKNATGQCDSVLAFMPHDHRRCKRESLRAVEALCTERTLRLTPVRRRALEILLEAHTALGAYQVLDKLAIDGLAEKPPQVYRALGFLIEQGFAHKLEGLNAYVACVSPASCNQPCFMVCVECGRVGEQTIPELSKQFDAAAEQLGFSPKASVMELSGVCAQCPSSNE